MILTICPNPCIDYTIEVENLLVGRLSRIENKIEQFAGKALNTAIGVSRLGESVTASGFMFDKGSRAFINYLERENVKCNFVVNKGSLRVNIKVIDSKSMLTELNDSGEMVTAQKQKELLELVKNISTGVDVTVISGSLPTGVKPEYYHELVKASNGKVIIDCEKDNLKSAISAGVYMVKPNLYELESFTGDTYRSYQDMLKGCQKMLDAGASKVLLSLGIRGAILTDGTNSFYCHSENVAVNSTVGAGDSMVAAASIGIKNGFSDEEILRTAVSAGTASVITQGTSLFTKDKFEEIYKKLKVTKMRML